MHGRRLWSTADISERPRNAAVPGGRARLSVQFFYFFPWRRAALQLALVAADYAATLLVLGTPFPFVRWSTTVMTAVVASTMVAVLRSRVDTLIEVVRRSALTDPVTMLRNRRAFDELFDLEVARADRSGHVLALVLGDLDGFKAVNDRLGHPEGDAVLRRVASRLDGSERRVDMALRLGGDEFALLLPGTDVDGACVVAERMRLAIAEEFAADQVRLTISFGIACLPDHGAVSVTLFLAADAALLTAKQQGRNRCVVAAASGAAARRTAQGPRPPARSHRRHR